MPHPAATMRAKGLRPLAPLTLLVLLTAACGSATPTTNSTPTPAAFTCEQPQPTSSTLTLAGVGYGPYHSGQDPTYGIDPSSDEIQADLSTLQTLTHDIRIYSATGPAQAIVAAAQARHMCVNLGIWLGPNVSANTKEIEAAESLASNPAVQSITVGSEVLLRGDLTAAELDAYLKQVRTFLTQHNLGHVIRLTMADEYGAWLSHPELARDVDFVTVHVYPYWHQVPIAGAMDFVRSAYTQLQQAFGNKSIVFGETGWPSAGHAYGAALPSDTSEASYLLDFATWAQQQHVPYFFFEAFDEGWKGLGGDGENGAGAHWGLYQQDGTLKPALQRLLPPPAADTLVQRSYRDIYVGSALEEGYGLGIDTSAQQRHWLTDEQGTLALDYPSNQQWGTMFITNGPAVPPGKRPSLDLSAYQSLLVDLRTTTGTGCVKLGIKDASQPDDGSETTVQECLTPTWSTIRVPLSRFAPADLHHLYTVFEVVFGGPVGLRVELRNVRYAPFAASLAPVGTPTPTAISTSAPTHTPTPIPTSFAVYTDAGAAGNHYVPSGFMGDYGAITLTQSWTGSPYHGATCIRVVYNGTTPQGQGWAGVYWQDPQNNWGTKTGGYNLSHFPHLRFWVRGDKGGEKVEFKVGGLTGTHGDSLQPAVSTGVITLTTAWQQVSLNLTGRNLTHIIGGFVWVANTTEDPTGATFYLDNIIFSAS